MTENSEVPEEKSSCAPRISATSGVEKDVLVVGDYNMIPPGPIAPRDRENFDAMNPTGFLQFISSEDLIGQGSHIRNGRIGNLLDG